MSNDIHDIGSLSYMWLNRPNWAEGMTIDVQASAAITRFGGGVDYLWQENTVAPKRLKFDYSNLTKAAEKELIDFFQARNGQHGCFWTPSWITNFQIIDDLVASDSVIPVRNDSFSKTYSGYERIAIVLASGDIIVREISGATEIDSTQENLTLVSPVDRIINMVDIDLCCLFLLVRFDMDVLSIKHITDSISETEITVYELVREYP